MAKATKNIFIITVIFSMFFLPLSPILAVTFNPDYILSDYEFTDKDAYSGPQAIEFFIKSKGGAVADYKMLVDGQLKTTSELIYESAQVNNISPKFLLTLLQKESGLVTASTFTSDDLDWAMGAGICDSCSKDDPEIILKYKGFDKQIRWAAELNRWYLDEIAKNGKTFTGWGPGVTKKTLDGIKVVPANSATAALYTYNPWVGKYGGGTSKYGANSLLWKRWTEWFTKFYPDGSLLKDKEEAGVWLIQNGLRRPFFSKSALLSRYSLEKVIEVAKNDLLKYEIGKPIKFSNYSLLRSPRGTVYLLVDDILRGIASREAFRAIGFNSEEIIDVEQEELAQYIEGAPITAESVYPTGALLQNKKTGGVYYVENGVKHPIWAKEILKSNFKNKKIVAVSAEELGKYPDSEPLKFKEGELVKSAVSPSVYVISNGLKRPIPSAEIFEGLGYKWGQVIITNEKALEAHSFGEPVRLTSGEVEIAINK
ncbi:MAG: hypothetical protein PHD51_01425 [Patescibacteria group bacterium]|nr:hypothetical protein [Patescibacteria group bacterium]MDD5490478.1 hypothetical protein [Patescibacteria group bacterium]